MRIFPRRTLLFCVIQAVIGSPCNKGGCGNTFSPQAETVYPSFCQCCQAERPAFLAGGKVSRHQSQSVGISPQAKECPLTNFSRPLKDRAPNQFDFPDFSFPRLTPNLCLPACTPARGRLTLHGRLRETAAAPSHQTCVFLRVHPCSSGSDSSCMLPSAWNCPAPTACLLATLTLTPLSSSVGTSLPWAVSLVPRLGYSSATHPPMDVQASLTPPHCDPRALVVIWGIHLEDLL